MSHHLFLDYFTEEVLKYFIKDDPKSLALSKKVSALINAIEDNYELSVGHTGGISRCNKSMFESYENPCVICKRLTPDFFNCNNDGTDHLTLEEENRLYDLIPYHRLSISMWKSFSFHCSTCTCRGCKLKKYVDENAWDEEYNSGDSSDLDPVLLRSDLYICDHCTNHENIFDYFNDCSHTCETCLNLIQEFNNQINKLRKFKIKKENESIVGKKYYSFDLTGLVSYTSDKIDLHYKKLIRDIDYLDLVNFYNWRSHCWTEEFSLCEHTSFAYRYPIICVFCTNDYAERFGDFDMELVSDIDLEKCKCKSYNFYNCELMGDMIHSCIFCNDKIISGKIPDNPHCKSCEECTRIWDSLIAQVIEKHKKSNHVCASCEYKKYL